MTAAVPAGGETGTSACPFSLPAPLRVVLDTNVLLSLWIFADSRYAPLRTALEDRRWQALSRADCLDEFGRVLNYPQFAVSPERQRRALEEYRQLAGVIAKPPLDAQPLPRCRDRDDQKFLEVARDGDAHWLVTSDKALLRLACRQKLAGLFRILTPDAALTELTPGVVFADACRLIGDAASSHQENPLRQLPDVNQYLHSPRRTRPRA